MYLSAVGSLHRHRGFKDPNHHNPQLMMVLRGTQQANLDKASHPRQRTVLHRLLYQVRYSHKLHKHDKDMLTAPFLRAYFGFLQVSSKSHLDRDLTLGLIQPKPASHIKRNTMLSQSKHQRQTSCAKDIRITYPALTRNFAHIQPCKSTLVTFPSPLQ